MTSTATGLPKLWKSLDQIPGATTDAWEWRQRLGSEWPLASTYLKATGRQARQFSCPSPGGEGCPRTIVEKAGGRFRAVCGNSPAECEAIEVTGDDIAILTLDRKKLAGNVRRILGAVPDDRPDVLGVHTASPLIRIPIVLLVPGPMIHTEMAGHFDGPTAIVVPTPSSLDRLVASRFREGGHLILALREMVVAEDGGRLGSPHTAAELLAPLCGRQPTSKSVKKHVSAWPLPSDARWEEVSLEFSSLDVLNVRFRGELKRFESENLGMKSAKTGRPTSAWVLLRSFAHQTPIKPRPGKDGAKLIKQKQVLSRRLREGFGIAEDPFRVDRGEGYSPRFLVRDTDPESFRKASGRAG